MASWGKRIGAGVWRAGRTQNRRGRDTARAVSTGEKQEGAPEKRGPEEPRFVA